VNGGSSETSRISANHVAVQKKERETMDKFAPLNLTKEEVIEYTREWKAPRLAGRFLHLFTPLAL